MHFNDLTKKIAAASLVLTIFFLSFGPLLNTPRKALACHDEATGQEINDGMSGACDEDIGDPPNDIAYPPVERNQEAIDEANALDEDTATQGGKDLTTKGTTGPAGQSTANGNSSASTTKTSNINQANGSAIGCALGNILSSVVLGAVGYLTDKAETYTGLAVPNAEGGPLLGKASVSSSAHEGKSVSGVLALPSWDALAYCIGNALIEYIANSTLQWINSGFDGNPSFVSNPEQFFTGIADQQAGAFIQQLVKGTTGLDICKPFRVSVALSALNSYNNGGRGQCSLTQAEQNFTSGSGGNISLKTFNKISQNPSNNYMGAQLTANNELQIRINTQQHLAEQALQRNSGYLDVKTQPKDGDGHPTGPAKTTVNGADTAAAAQNTRNLANLRLVAATKFDQVITSLVNQLIKVALNKLNESTHQ